MFVIAIMLALVFGALLFIHHDLESFRDLYFGLEDEHYDE